MELVEVSNTVHSNWKELNLGESAILKARIGWQGLTTAEYLDTGNYYLITGTDFKNGFIDWDNCVFVEKNRYDQDKNIQVQVGDVLVTKDGTIGKVAFVDKVPKPTTLNSGVFVIRPKNKAFDTKYFYYVLMSNHFADFLSRLTAGSTISHLYQKDFVHFNFPLPPIQEQKAIAQVLSDTDDLIQAIEQKLAKKRAIKQGAMQKLLTPKEDWELKKLKDVGEVKMCKRIFNNETKEQGDIPFYKIGTFGKAPDSFISKSLFNHYRNKFSYPKKGDILISASGTIGRTIVFDGKPSYFQDSNIIWLDNDEKLISNQFLWYIYQIVSYQTEGGTIQRLYNSILYNTEFYCPTSKDEQTRIATILSDMDGEIEQLEKKLSKYKMVKQGLMQNLLTGKIRLV